MFDILLKTKFYSKCKSDIKLTRTRLDMIIKKRNAMHKFLRNDIAHLLQNGLDTIAYARAEGLLVEMNKSSSYDFIEQCSVCVSTHLSDMDKHKDCPEECKEAVSSLMFAAARFADLPELRDLRTVFSDRYGNSLDCFVNKQFVEMFKPGLPSKDSKLQLLQDTALEYGLQWNSKALENSLYNEAQPKKDCAKETSNDVFILRDNMNASFQKKDRHEFKNPREVLPLKYIQIDDTTRRNEKLNKTESLKSDPNKEETDNEKPIKYKSIPSPYTKSEVNKAKSSMDDTKPLAKSVRRSFRLRESKENIGSCTESSEEEKMKDINKEEKAALAQKILKLSDKERHHPEGKEQEKMIDRLLRYYTRKNERSSSNLRSLSLPGESETTPPPNETPPKTHTRASSFQPGNLNGNHLHPKLPDYDDFVAQVAASRRN